MKRNLNKHEIDYLAGHLEQLYQGPAFLSCLVSEEGDSPGIFIPPSHRALNESKVFFIGKIPVLFPTEENKLIWYSSHDKQVIFHHDILKSAFYLLSGYQELQDEGYDKHGRYSWEYSIQKRLGITEIPVVNYYFDILLDAIEKHCQAQGIPFKRNTPLSPALFLSHDVDRIRKYSLKNVYFVSMHLLGIKAPDKRMKIRWRNFVTHTRGTLFFKKEPYWNFESMMLQEKELGIHSTWFMLENQGKGNSSYRFNDKKIRQLMLRLSGEGHEIGIHGTFQSHTSVEVLSASLIRLSEAFGGSIQGGRQHWLRYRSPETSIVHEACGLKWDSSIGFADKTGFRRSYCYPFKPYDFANKRSIDVWQLPLLVMDVSLLEYQSLSLVEMQDAIEAIKNEVSAFNGVFALLWHNCRLDEEEYPGVQEAYRQILTRVIEQGFIPATGSEIILERTGESEVIS